MDSLPLSQVGNTQITFLINGGASGADTLSTLWALENQVSFREYRAEWNDLDAPNARIKYTWGKPYNANAGFDRNQKMLDEGKPDVVVAFPGGSGTADMVKRAKEAGVEVIEIEN